jgi:hypothetical protein
MTTLPIAMGLGNVKSSRKVGRRRRRRRRLLISHVKVPPDHDMLTEAIHENTPPLETESSGLVQVA